MKMKDSGVEWIGEIPEGWRVEKGKYVFQRQQRSISVNETVTAFRDGQVVQRKKRRTDGFTESLQEIGYQGIKKGDLVIHSMDAFAGAIGISEDDGKSSPVYIVLNTDRNDIYNPYFSYLMRAYALTGYIESMAKGIRVRSTDYKYQTFAATPLLIPPISKQIQIVDYVSGKIALIDQIIADTKYSIEELKAYKQSLITETVTKGLDPNVPMKDSGVEWIGEIPEGWKVRKAKYFGNVRNGLTYKPEQLVDEKEGILILRSGNIQDGKLSFEDNQYVAGEIQKNLMVKNDDILITSRNGSAKLIGKSAIINNNIQATFGAFMMLFTPNQTVNAQYFCYLLNSNGFDFYRGLFSSSTINQLTRKTFNNMSFPYPKKEIQKEIVLFLDERIKKLDDIIKDKNLVISENESYKKSLIYEYVTGKKQVN